MLRVFPIIIFIVLGLTPQVVGSSVIDVASPTIEDRIGRAELAKALQTALEGSFADDQNLALLPYSQREPRYRVHIMIKIDDRYPDRESIFASFKAPGGTLRYLTLTYAPEMLDSEQSTSWLVKKVSSTVTQQLKAEGLPGQGPRLHSDLSRNVVFLNPDRRRLEVELVGGSHRKSDSAEAFPEQFWNKPTVQRRQDSESRALLGYGRSPATDVIDPLNPPKVDVRRGTIPLDPFEAQVQRERQWQPSFSFPRFLTAGPTSLFLTPSLGRVETDPRWRYTVETQVSWLQEDFSGYRLPFTRYRWQGEVLRQHLALSTRLWQILDIALDTGMGGRQVSGVELEVPHSSAPGGTTFLANQNLDQGLLDSTLTVTVVHEMERFTLRPFIQVKVATGDSHHLLGSGKNDYGAGTSLEWSVNGWHLRSLLSLTSPGDLDIFANGQAELQTSNYLYGSFGIGRELNIQRGERVAFSINAMQNPMRSATSLDDLDQEILTFNALIEKDFGFERTLRCEILQGATSSSPGFGFQVGFRARF